MHKQFAASYLSSLLFLFSSVTYAQGIPVDSIGKQITVYGNKSQAPVLFVHFDKTIYSNNESIWFSAYLLKATNMDAYKILTVACIKDDDHSVVKEDKFVMKNGLASGNILIPDTVPPGNYSLMAYTNRLLNGKPQVTFTQPITIKSADAQTFKALLNPVDTGLNLAEQKVMLMVNNTGIDPLPGVPVSYYVGNTAHQVMAGKAKTDASGQYVFAVPSKLLSQGTNKLYVQVKYNKEIKAVSIDLPVPKQSAQIRFYPEGGNLVNDITNTVGFEVKTAIGNPLKITASLYQNNDSKPVQTIETSSYGMGRFNITPQAGSSYYVKLNGIVQKDTGYKLPAAIPGGPAITVKQATVNDTLDVELHDNNPEKVYLLVHNYKQLFFTVPVMMNSKSKKVKVLLDGIPKGLTQLTLTDSLGRPFAERIFFAHYNQRTPVQITTDQSEYGTRKKVTVKVKLDALTADTGLISIACIQANHIEIKKQLDIESYVYLKNDLGELPSKEDYLGNEEADKQYLEDILLVKGWSRYKWTDVLKAKVTDSLQNYQTPVFKGTVTLFDKPLKKPVELILMNQGKINNIKTNNTGDYTLNDELLTAMPNEKLLLSISGAKPEGYRVYFTDPYPFIDTMLAKKFVPTDYSTPEQQNTQYTQLADNKQAIHLKKVIINNDNTLGMYYSGANACGDYVCRYGVLDCSNHPHELDNVPPVIGKAYSYNRKLIVYEGCIEPLMHRVYIFQLKGIYSAKEFYGEDYSKESLPQPEYQSTIYWKNLAAITSSTEKEFSFYTSDITGKFKVVVQGITNNDVVYGTQTFEVVKGEGK